MCSVAEWLISCAFTAAPGDLFCFFNFHFHGCHAGIEAHGSRRKTAGLQTDHSGTNDMYPESYPSCKVPFVQFLVPWSFLLFILFLLLKPTVH